MKFPWIKTFKIPLYPFNQLILLKFPLHNSILCYFHSVPILLMILIYFSKINACLLLHNFEIRKIEHLCQDFFMCLLGIHRCILSDEWLILRLLRDFKALADRCGWWCSWESGVFFIDFMLFFGNDPEIGLLGFRMDDPWI